MACTLCADVGSYVRRFPTRYTSKMKLVVALALAAAMPSAQAIETGGVAPKTRSR